MSIRITSISLFVAAAIATAATMPAVAADAAANDYFYSYFKQPLPLQLDTGRIAVQQRGADPAPRETSMPGDLQMHDMMGMAILFDAISKQPHGRHGVCRRRPAQHRFRTLWRAVTGAFRRRAGRC